MATIANLKVMLTAKTAAFTKGMRGAGRVVTRFGNKARAAVGAVRMLSGSLLPLAAGAGLTVMATRSAAALDKLSKTAFKLGAVSEELATQGHAAKLSGLEVATYEMALQRLVKRVGNVAVGGAAMGKMVKKTQLLFKEINVDAKELAKLPADQIFRKWMWGMRGIANQAKRVALAAKFVDSEGVAVLNMMEAMTTGYKKMVQLTESLGIRFTQNQLAMVTQMDDAFLNFRTKIMGIVGQTLIRLAPYLQAIFERMTAWLGNPAKVAETLVGWMGKLARAALRVVSVIVKGALEIGRILATIGEAVLTVSGYMLKAFGEGFPDAIWEASLKLRDLRKQIEQKLETGGWMGFFNKVTGFFERAVTAAKKTAAAVVGIPLGRMNLETADGGSAAAAAAAKRYSVRSVRASEFGGFTGGRPAARSFFGGSIEMKVQSAQLATQKLILAAIQKGQAAGLGS